MAIENLGPFDWRIPIVTPEGRPTSEFQRRWKLQVDNNNEIGSAGDPTAIASDVAINGTENTYMRSDAAPAIQKATDTQFGVVKVDGTSITEVGGVISAGGGGGGSAWSLIDQSGNPITSGTTWTWSSNVSTVDVINLTNYTDILVVSRALTTSVATLRCIQVSTDNGATFFSASGDYVGITDTGLESNQASMITHQSVTGSARTLIGHIYGLALPGPRVGIGTGPGNEGRRLFVINNLPINAIRLTTLGPVTTFTAGNLRVYAR